MTRQLPNLSALRVEVRKLSRKASKMAESVTCRSDGEGYHSNLVGLFDDWMAKGNAHRQVVCLAAATELGLPVVQYAEQCHAAVTTEGSEALRVLYWTVAHRVRATQPPWVVDPHRRVPSVASEAKETRPPCHLCVELSRDPMQGGKHSKLATHHGVQWRKFGQGTLFEVQEYRCAVCGSVWTKRHSVLDPFTAWTMT